MIAAWMARNRAEFERQGAVVPPPRLFLSRLSEALDRGRDLDPLAREDALLRSLGASGTHRWMAVSAPGLLGAVDDVIAPEGFYVRDVARRLHGLRTLFPRCTITLMLAVRSPATMLPAILPDDPEMLASLLPMLDGDTLPWAALVATIRHHLPAAQLVAWRHENLAGVWPDILAQIVGPGRVLPPAGLLDFATLGLSAQARLRFERYCAANPPPTAGHMRQLAEAFGRRYGHARLSAPAESLPGWARTELDRLDAGYVTEWADISGRADVHTLFTRTP
ncbi:MAG: hypothetical protein H6898_04975 [Rhodobacter sp.]|nr:hypothetical protein [Paracoccaceae bacterium]MCC0075924.1 hypothetical protein [Rhodobacter sp.]